MAVRLITILAVVATHFGAITPVAQRAPDSGRERCCCCAAGSCACGCEAPAQSPDAAGMQACDCGIEPATPPAAAPRCASVAGQAQALAIVSAPRAEVGDERERVFRPPAELRSIRTIILLT